MRTIDLRDRCQHCNKLIAKNAMAQRNWKLYAPYCRFHCQETHRMSNLLNYVRTVHGASHE